MSETFTMTEEQTQQRRMEAVFAHEEAKDERSRLIFELKAIGRKAAKIAALAEAIENEPESPLQSEVPLLMLTQRDFEGMDFNTVRGVANSIAASRKKVADAAELRRIQRG
jgi:hypothetical protein